MQTKPVTRGIAIALSAVFVGACGGEGATGSTSEGIAATIAAARSRAYGLAERASLRHFGRLVRVIGRLSQRPMLTAPPAAPCHAMVPPPMNGAPGTIASTVQLSSSFLR